jgi:MFS family permease
MESTVAARAAHPRRILAVLFGGVLIAALDIAVVGPALPAIRASFAVDGRALSWVFSIYILCYLVGAPVLAKLSDRQGRRRVYVQSLALFAAGSLIVAAAPTFWILLAGRAVQAFGAGGVLPVASAVIAETFPPEQRGRWLGLIGAVFGLAFLLGPLLGGVLLPWGWQWLFLINLPAAAVLVAIAARSLPTGQRAGGAPFDVAGALLLALVLGALVLGVNNVDATAVAASVLSARVWPYAALAAAAAAALWHVERRAADPVVPPALFGSIQLRAVGVIALAAGVVEAGMVFLPDVAVLGLAATPAAASWMMLPLVATLMVGAPAAGLALERWGPRPIVQAGLVLTAAGLGVLALPLASASFYGGGALIGCGLAALLGAPLRYITLQEAGAGRLGAGQGLLTLFLSVGQLLGSAAVGGVVGSSADELAGYRQSFVLLAAACGVGLLASLALRGRAGDVAPDEPGTVS